ncbi:sensor histidine kinase [Psychromonas sp. KJ10-10]|uniref:sensor histidine kinase n=1 Tax=Psychromonas sp. KJ10-10 TaxID=3391823 RepID=UPI0039B3E323
MKIRLSIRYYFLGAVLLLASCMVIAFSVLTANYFNEGRDSILHRTMVQMAEIEGVTDGHPVNVIDFQIASRWQDLTEDIQLVFEEQGHKAIKLNKIIVSDSIFSRPKAGYFVVDISNSKGEKRYVAKVLEPDNDAPIEKRGMPHFIWIFAFAISGIAIFLLMLLLIMRTVAKPIEALRHWASSLNEKSLQQTPPDFQYKELNSLAEIVHNSLNTVQDSLHREHEFLRFASHELRTPIAVIRTNVELLRKINESEKASIKQNRVVERIERAGFTMSHLTETLLWLSRGDSIPPAIQKIQLNELVLRLIEELSYLLQGKTVDVTVQTSECQIELPETACRIVLTNLIRNAFQHTQNGIVSISQQGQSVIINSKEIDNDDEMKSDSNELGFGLGLKLTEKLVQQFNWQCQCQAQQTGHIVEVNFITENN